MQKIMYDQMPQLAQQLIAKLDTIKIFRFVGPLGAGKTTLAGMFIRQLGVQGPVQSPTFTYVSAYTADNGLRIFHFDLYRIESLDAFLQAGFDEYLYQPNSICIIEWPEVIGQLLKESVCTVNLDYVDTESRSITVTNDF